MKKTLLPIGMIMAGLAMAGSASASTACIGSEVTAAQQQTFAFGPNLNGSADLNFDGFSGPGTLCSVHLQFVYSEHLENTAAVLFNSGDQSVGSPTPLSATATTTVSITGFPSLTSSNSLTTPGFVGIVQDGFLNVVGTADIANLAVGPAVLQNSTALDSFIGGVGIVTVNVASAGSQGGSVPSVVLTGNQGTASGVVSLWYDFNRAPPPPNGVPEIDAVAGTGALTLLVGAVALAGERRRRRS